MNSEHKEILVVFPIGRGNVLYIFRDGTYRASHWREDQSSYMWNITLDSDGIHRFYYKAVNSVLWSCESKHGAPNSEEDQRLVDAIMAEIEIEKILLEG